MPSPVNPGSIANLIAWFRADSLTLSDSTRVSSWTSAGGTETAALAQGTAGRQPLYRSSLFNGLPAIQFDVARTDALDTGAWGASYAVPNTAFVVGRKTLDNNIGNFFTGRAGVFNYIGNSDTESIDIGAGTALQMSSATGISLTTVHAICAVYNGASSALYVDSTTPTTGTTGGANSNMPGMRVSSNSGDTANYLTGDIAEIIFYNAALDSTTIGQVLAYIDSKYHLGLGIARAVPPADTRRQAQLPNVVR